MDYIIGGHLVRILSDSEKYSLNSLIPSFSPFLAEKSEGQPLVTVTLMEKVRKVPEGDCHLIRDIDTGNGMTRVDRLSDGGYQFLIRDITGYECGLLIASLDFASCHCAIRGNEGVRRFAFNNILMLAYSFSAARHDTLLIHASVIRHQGMAIAFTAKSGTGKSTQVANWMRHIPGCDIVNDDNPIIRMLNGKPVLYGSPWSGKTPCYRNIMVPLAAVMLIERDDHNHVVPMRPLIAFSTVLGACSSMKWDEAIYQDICQTASRFVETTKVASLHCLPDRESAETCRQYVFTYNSSSK